MSVYHKELKLKKLDYRRTMFMLKMMYKLSKEEDNVERYRPEMLLRTGPKFGYTLWNGPQKRWR